MINKKILYACTWAVLAAMTSSCVDEWSHAKVSNGPCISFTSSQETFVSRSAGRGCDTLMTLIGKDSLFFSGSVQPRKMVSWREKKSQSRAMAVGEIDYFHLNAWQDEDKSILMQSIKVQVDGDRSDYSPACYWPLESTVSFIAWGGVSATGTIDGIQPVYDMSTGTGRFDYTLPAAIADERADAEQQPDLLFAYIPTRDNDGGAVPVSLRHALSAITFKVGSMPENTVVNSITLKGLSQGGSCRFPGSAGEGEPFFVWSASAAVRDFSQDIAVTTDGTVGDVLSTPSTTFMMIPQTLPQEARVIIRFTVGQQDYTFEAPLSVAGFEQWLPEYEYTYSISLRQFMQVSVSSELQGEARTIRGPLLVQNTGLAVSYVRVAVNGYWQDENLDDYGNRIIVMPWNLSDTHTGTVTWGDGWSSLWGLNAAGDDGFYYYRKPVGIGLYTDIPFFERYELTANPPTKDSSLEMNVIVQSVPADRVNECWAVTLTDGLIDVIPAY